MIAQIIHTLVHLILFLLLVRVHINYYAFLRTPLESKIIKITDLLVIVFKNFFPRRRIEIAPIFVAYLVCLLLALASGIIFWKAILIAALNVVEAWINLILVTVIISVLASWLQTPPTQPFLRVVNFCHSWISAPIRQRIPNFQTLDFSPIIVILLIDIASLLIKFLMESLALIR